MILIFKNNNTVVCATDKSGENKNRNTVQQMKDETLYVHRVYNTLYAFQIQPCKKKSPY